MEELHLKFNLYIPMLPGYPTIFLLHFLTCHLTSINSPA